MNKRILIFAVIGIVSAAALLLLVRRSSSPAKVLKISGVVEVTTTELSFKIAGRLLSRLVDEGMPVRIGQEVARLEDDELQQERASRLADEKAGRAALADLQAGNRREEIAAAEATLARMKAEALRSASDAGRAEKLYQREVIPRKELEFAVAGRDVAAAAVREAEQRLKLLKAGARPDAVRQSRARLEASAAGVALSETRLSQAVLKSPLAGIVLAKHAEAGEMMAAGAPVVSVGALDQVWLRGYIPESEVGRVKLGQAARASFDSWPGRNFEGQVSFIASEAEFTPRNVQTEKERVKLVYRIKITLANPKGELKPGMPGDAVIVTETQKL